MGDILLARSGGATSRGRTGAAVRPARACGATALLGLQRAAGNRAVTGHVAALGAGRSGAIGSTAPIVRPITWPVVLPTVQRNADEDLAEYIAKDLAQHVATSKNPYPRIRSTFASIKPAVEDNLAAAFVEMLNRDQLLMFAASADGRAVLDVLTEAMLTGSVTSFETLQAGRVLAARGTTITPEQYRAEATRIAELRSRDEDSLGQAIVNRKARQEARELNELAQHKRYREIKAKVDDEGSTDDNLSAHFLELQTDAALQLFAADPAGRAMLDTCYEAMLTGSVTAFERQQGDRVLQAKVNAAPPSDQQIAAVLEDPPVFALDTGWDSTATIVAELTAAGKVNVYYDTHNGANRSEFRADMDTLNRHYGDGKRFSGIVLDPADIVVVKLYNAGGVKLPVPAIKLIDFFNQQKEDTLGKIKTVAVLGATVGLGGVGAPGVLGWADTIAFAINVGSIFVNEHRDEIAKTAGGKRFLAVWDVAVGVADLYGWGRLGVDGLRLIHAKVAPALKNWRAEVPANVGTADRKVIAEAQTKTQAWLDGVEQAQAAEAAKLAKNGGKGDPHPTGKSHPATDVPEPAGTGSSRTTGHGTGVGVGAKAEATRYVPAAGSEIKVSGRRIEVCQRCPDLGDAVGAAKTNTKVAAEVTDAKSAAVGGNAGAAAVKAEVAMVDAHKINVAQIADLKKNFARELSANPALAKEWETINRMKPGPTKNIAARDFEGRLGSAHTANTTYFEGVRGQARDLRARAKKDPTAAHELRELYAAQPEWVLKDLKRLEKEELEALKAAKVKPKDRPEADSVLADQLERKRLQSADVKVQTDEFRPPHEAEVWVNDKTGKRLASKHYVSGDVMKADQATYGWREANARSHTEAKALREMPPHKGETMYISGTYNPCPRCAARMQEAVDKFGGTIVYLWPGGPKGGLRYRRGGPPERPQ